MSRRPRIGFLGVGWIGRHRLEAVLASGVVEVAALADPEPACLEVASGLAPGAWRGEDLSGLLEQDLDGVVIATPSAQHAAQAAAALERGHAVFCQKPLGRDARETRQVVEAARGADRRLGVDLSYRFTRGMALVREALAAGAIGEVFCADLVFHNAYGPDKPWFYDPAQSGGGCVVDLGIHLVDLALHCLGFPEVEAVSSRLYAEGRPLGPAPEQVEDYAVARLDLASGATARLACSWRLSAGQDAVIAATFHGTRGGLSFRNVDGSFYDFVTERYHGTSREVLDEPPDAWGGRAVVDWARHVASDVRYDPQIEQVVRVAEVLDAIYGRRSA